MSDKKHPSYKNIRLGSLIRQKYVQHSLFSKMRYIRFASIFILIVASIVLITTIPDVISGGFGVFFHSLKHNLLTICGKLPSEESNIYKWDMFLFLLGKVLIWCILLPWALTSILSPVNPIHFAGAVVIKKGVDGHDVMVFRYWLMKRAGDFLSNVHLVAYLQDKRAAYSEEAIEPLFMWKAKLNCARGIRQWTCDIDEAIEAAKRKAPYNGKPKNFWNYLYSQKKETNYRIIFSIRGTDDSGRTFSAIKQYSSNRIFYGAEFARIRESEYSDNKNEVDLENEYMKYQNFNKIILHEEPFSVDGHVLKNKYQEETDREIRVISKTVEKEDDNFLVMLANRRCKKYFNTRQFKQNIKKFMQERKVDVS